VSMGYASNIHVAVYQVLDQVMTANVPPPGAKAAIHSIIDDLYSASAPRKMIAQAESISLQLHHLEGAVARQDAPSICTVHQILRSIAAEWLDQRITS
jgi:hypothetical protein